MTVKEESMRVERRMIVPRVIKEMLAALRRLEISHRLVWSENERLIH